MSDRPSASKLIIIRGPSGSGKSTITARLMRETNRLTVHIDQDVYRFMLTDQHAAGDMRREIMYQNTLLALNSGCDVIIEGILSGRSQAYKKMFERLLKEHDGESYIFYLDIPFEETVRRHATRPQSDMFTAEEMLEWYDMAGPLRNENEVIINARSTLDQTVTSIKQKAGL